MSHKNFDALKKSILDKAKEGMNASVLPVIKSQLKDSIKERVYDVYTPIEYNRREYANGGLGDMSTMMGHFQNGNNGGFQYMVQSEAMSNDGTGLIAPLIIKGQMWALTNYVVRHTKIPSYDRMAWVNKIGFTPFYEPRDFIVHAKSSLSKQTLSNKLSQYMKK